jgi:hypothetical protein
MEKGLRGARRAARVDRAGSMSTATTSWRHDREAQLGEPRRRDSLLDNDTAHQTRPNTAVL